jgi:hypothetical protein
MAYLLYVIERLLRFQALFNIRCVLSRDISSDWIETNIHHDLKIWWMI